MPQLRTLVTSQGAEFINAFVHTPICCPSRSSFLTGRYIHNSLTFQNGLKYGCSNETWREGPETRSYAVHAKAAGYRTHYSGKYLNQYALPGSVEGCKKKPTLLALRTYRRAGTTGMGCKATRATTMAPSATMGSPPLMAKRLKIIYQTSFFPVQRLSSHLTLPTRRACRFWRCSRRRRATVRSRLPPSMKGGLLTRQPRGRQTTTQAHKTKVG